MINGFRRMSKLVAALGLVACLVGMVGCGKEVPAYDVNPTMSNLSDHQQADIKIIIASGAQVLKRGMLFRFILPIDTFFDRDSRALKVSKEKALFAMGNFLSTYQRYFNKPRIVVAGFSDRVWLYPKRKHLSQQYANTVARYLAIAQVPLKVKNIKGYGAKHPIASNKYPKGTAYNRRVEVWIE